MRWFLVAAVAVVGLTLADTAPAKAQIIIGGNPTYYPQPRYSGPFFQYPRVVYATPAPVPATPAPIPYYNGSTVDYGMDWMMRSVGWTGYGPYAGNYGQFVNPRYYGGVVRSYTQPSTYWNAVDPRNSIPKSPKGWFNGAKGFGKWR
jgi:hypothetical protein